ncbi:MAG: hypothetical protein ACLFVR_00685 [Thiohalospira sp.]
MKIIGTSDLSAKQKFSKETLTNTTKEFRKLQIKRGEWINDYQVFQVERIAPYNSGEFIIEKFEFTKKNYTTIGNMKYEILLIVIEKTLSILLNF